MNDEITLNGGTATITLNLREFMREVWDDDAEQYRSGIVNATADRLAKSLAKDVATAVRDRIQAEVEIIVRDTIGAGVQKVSAWGEPTGETTPLRDLIGKAAEDALRKPELRDGYNRGTQPTMVQRIIANEVEKAFKAEVKDHVKEAQAAAVAAVKKSAAEVIGETIDRARRGLA